MDTGSDCGIVLVVMMIVTAVARSGYCGSICSNFGGICG